MSRIVAWIQEFAANLGGLGLFIVAFLDSSFLSLPQINDLLLIWMVTLRKELVIYYALMATAGSVAGCLVLYGLARKGGEAFIRRRFSEERLERGLDTFQRHGLLAVLVPSILPPPAPFKIFVLLAGVAKVHPMRFALAVALGRGLRFFGAGILAVLYGEQAMAFLQEHARPVLFGTAGLVAAGAAGWYWWKRRAGARAAGR